MIGNYLALGQFILDCDGQRDSKNPVCTLSPYSAPPATVDHFSIAPTWSIVVIAVVAIIIIIATAMVRFRRHERLETEFAEEQRTKQAEAAVKHTQCPTCGTVYVPEGKA